MCETKAISFHLLSDSHPLPDHLFLEDIASRSTALVCSFPLFFVCLCRVGTIRWKDICWRNRAATALKIVRELGRRCHHLWHLKNAHSLCKAGVPGFPVSQMSTIKGKTYHTTWIKLSLFSMTHLCLQYNLEVQEAWSSGTSILLSFSLFCKGTLLYTSMQSLSLFLN